MVCLKNQGQCDRVVGEEKDMSWDRWAGARLSRPFRLGQAGSYEHSRTRSQLCRLEEGWETREEAGDPGGGGGGLNSSSVEAVAQIMHNRDHDLPGAKQGLQNFSCCCYCLKL